MKLEKLKNGLRVITVPVSGTNVVTLLILVKAGSRYEEEKISGISHFAEHMFFKGTNKLLSSLAIASEIDSVGGVMNAFTSKEYTGFFVKISKKHLERAFEVLSDILQNSLFRSDDIEKEKLVITQEINMYEDTPIQKIDELFEQTLYSSNPLGRDIIGKKETVANIKQQDLKDYIDKLYRTKNIVIIVAGAIKNNEDIRTLAERYFHFQPLAKELAFEKVIENQAKPQIKIKKQKTEQAHLCLGVRGYNTDDSKKFTLELIAVILGGSMSSRLFEEIREKHSLAYYIKSENQSFKDCGFLYAKAGVDLVNIKKTIQIILQEMKKLKKETITDKELTKAKEYFKGKITIDIEDSFSLAQLYGLQELLDKKTRTLEEIFTLIDKISAQDIKKVANEVFVNKKLNLAVIASKVNKNLLRKILKF